jgi:hypothetical protein
LPIADCRFVWGNQFLSGSKANRKSAIGNRQ